jgi:hypothetical protein
VPKASALFPAWALKHQLIVLDELGFILFSVTAQLNVAVNGIPHSPFGFVPGIGFG